VCHSLTKMRFDFSRLLVIAWLDALNSHDLARPRLVVWVEALAREKGACFGHGHSRGVEVEYDFEALRFHTRNRARVNGNRCLN